MFQENDDDMRYLMLGEEGFLSRPEGDTWYEESEVVNLDGLKDIASDREKTSEALSFVCDKSKDRTERLERLLSLDQTHAFRDSNIPGENLLDIWESDKVSRYWKSRTLARVMEQQFYGVNVVPLQYQWRVARAMVRKSYAPGARDYLSRGSVLKMLHDGDFRGLDEFTSAGMLSSLGPIPSTWGQMLLHVIMLADYDNATSDGNRYLRPAVSWIEMFAPGSVANAIDGFGNNALVYLAATLAESNPSYLMRTQDGVAMAEEDASFLMSLGCKGDRKNIFGISYDMLSPR